jgi:MarR family 2-MHQ and catechol resistance regulon transcriptional repressor
MADEPLPTISPFAREIDRLNRHIKRVSAEVAEESGLTVLQLMVLLKLRRGGRRPMSDLKDELDVTTGAVTGLVDRLERLGLVVRNPSEEDRRVTFLALTPEGVEAAKVAIALWERKLGDWLGRVEPEVRAHVMPVLKALVEAGSLSPSP